LLCVFEYIELSTKVSWSDFGQVSLIRIEIPSGLLLDCSGQELARLSAYTPPC